MLANKITKPAKSAKVVRLATAATKPVKQPIGGVPHKRFKWGDRTADAMANRLPTHLPFLIGTTPDVYDDDFGELTWIGIHGWKGDNRSPWDKHVHGADRMLRARGLDLVGLGQRYGTVVFLYRGGDEHDRAIVGEYLRRARHATSKGRPYLRRIV